MSVTTLREPHWNFESGAFYWLEREFGYGSRVAVDPMPGYAHDEDLVRAMLVACQKANEIVVPFAPEVLLISHEVTTRTNGQTHLEWDYHEDPAPEDDTQRRWHGVILLSGKRIPPHPATTRYLVGHEYGHVVEDWIIRQRHEKPHSSDLLDEYAEMRGLPHREKRASGGRWHEATQEVFACDFRLLRAGIEPEFWPHPGIARPDEVPGLAEWWAER